MKKILSLLLACLTLLCLAMPASAAISNPFTVFPGSRTYSYTHTDSGTKLSVPRDWDTTEKENGKTLFSNNTGSSLFMMMQGLKLNNESGKTLSNDDFTQEEFAELLGAKPKDVKLVTLGGQEYYTAQTKKTLSGSSMIINSWICVNHDWVYIYHFGQKSSHNLFDDFQTMIASAQYPGDSSNTGANVLSGDYLGGRYQGGMSSNVPHGKGTLTWENSSFTGYFEYGVPTSGTFTFADCSTQESSDWGWVTNQYRSWVPERTGSAMYYTGMTLDGKPWGYGMLDFRAGGEYEGEFQYGDPEGWGIYTYLYPTSEKREKKVSSEWFTIYHDKRHSHDYCGLKTGKKWYGFGVGIKSSGTAYCGEVWGDYRDGYGEVYNKKDQLERHGMYKNGEYVKQLPQP